ncbi:MAG: hypothetical protein AB8G15_11690 [Saprospiraceae bacterium]
MITTVPAIRTRLKDILLSFKGPLKVRVDKETNFEVAGTIEVMQGKKKVDGFYFSSLVPKVKDVRFYFFPAYTHADEFTDLSETLQKFKKGKSCFHIKYLNDELEVEIKKMVAKAVQLYQQDGWLSK